ncbi:Na(+)/H(+) antiporter subunit C [Arcanobacterium haemolyticum]|uniref:Multisubunit sodium/proton antiporter, MrpC subunit n=1 Tax=Arcanobacterium haemolyticum (strain ATCC 9345 / DSM 20595 / CCM 5947 / CCUG 17215 / LMG 16163 / NBRC 15585 / NCTC 8452 / 11018) TaxID=644284 RepID=D7BLW3_ARCHD|nr:Na(+)/H(+) antiporter subunit C [Arcanobacterium haemolyticum]ADH91912.1 multisubunit sodium/proton antiporter, MrpC subunit [Arcanobacterium haemolyticum DSM 20595]QCX46096.1 Na(+)/H(+) antiporter subunit C [Arcanobacterium haemolyticum]SPT74615.1 Multiple resistance and pH homeostasis protein C [Arcanobacterium haemolyticum]SQH26990.1 Multiple resistance and pH homeostasis protein C [Arcanobacterium haemolyticum]
MESSLALIILAGVLMAVGVYLVLERSLARVIIGLSAITNSVNIVFLIAGGASGEPPLVGGAAPEKMADPLVQAMMLTAIVLSLGLTAFLLSVGYRSWQLHGNDEVQDDLEDQRLARRSEAAKIAERADKPERIEVDAEAARDETESFEGERV